ncbi:MAG: deoxyribodipyrimidine photo-lyase [Proteobacteria bacterium]|nr:deoxyribodipyrimidine photo-lyase [Pseudomonadota bacterium]
MTDKITLFWFRQDLRISDNPGLFEAAKRGPVMPIYILEEDILNSFKRGSASKWWLNQSLAMLNKALNNNLNLYKGNPKDLLLEIIQKNYIEAVFWNTCFTPWHLKKDDEIIACLEGKGIKSYCFNASLLWDPSKILKKEGSFYKVFTPFYQQGCLRSLSPRYPLPTPEKLILIKDNVNPTTLSDLNLLTSKKWYQSLALHWKVGEKAAQNKLESFLDQGLQGYKEGRNYPAQFHTSRLSPYLHFGEISPNQVWHAIQSKNLYPGLEKDVESFLRELGWREFSSYLLYHFPTLPDENFQSKFNDFPWEENKSLLKAWQKGQTGYPLVDAGMRELWQTGYMHNRVRMVVASFLVKNLLLHWRYGADWFWDCLIDADLANNSASWQWVAGSGADASPYFRIFNPVLQGKKFDPKGEYTCQYVPELKSLPKKYLFNPWDAPAEILKSAGVVLGQNYPYPIVDLKQSRLRALKAFKMISK